MDDLLNRLTKALEPTDAAISAAPAEAPALLAHLLAGLSAFTVSESLADDVTLFVVTNESQLRKV